MYKDYIVFLILVFFGITYSFSLLEKILNWKPTISFYREHFKTSFLSKNIDLAVGLVCVLEAIVLLILAKNSYNYYLSSSVDSYLEFLLSSACLILFLLVGQRIAKDYQGATSLGVYFIVNLIGIYCL